MDFCQEPTLVRSQHHHQSVTMVNHHHHQSVTIVNHHHHQSVTMVSHHLHLNITRNNDVNSRVQLCYSWPR